MKGICIDVFAYDRDDKLVDQRIAGTAHVRVLEAGLALVPEALRRELRLGLRAVAEDTALADACGTLAHVDAHTEDEAAWLTVLECEVLA